MVGEDQIHSTISGEEAEIRIHEMGLPKTIMDRFNSNDWKEKKEAFVELGKWVPAHMDTLKPYTEHLFRYIKAKMKDWKESNINIMKEAFPFLLTIIKNPDISFSKQCFDIIAPFAINNLGEAKYNQPASELITLSCEVVNPKIAVKISLEVLQDAKNPKAQNTKTMVEANNLLAKLVNDLTLKYMPFIELVDYAKHCFGNSNQGVRTASGNLLKAIYK
mmetsp:Transcript_27959/g.24626  ORF Transcript_27959/g.24626 Transcript_27959/m.24626 type:complete len:219 (-) Transcript_27959:375-1031(-)